ncbi:uncharacterized protein LOC143254023 [Tachypleus tridentatus]|uniref:uncharacterized protein LOC143254023 n=1 Tax=Tachypleus tridentatus TaxID=6853 RepID=UPI003FD19F30
MPGSVGGFKHTDSTGSDRSDVSNDSRASGKKVSFNKAVRIKKYPMQMDIYTDTNTDDLSSDKKCRFKVSKNRRKGNRKLEPKKGHDYCLKNQDGRWHENRNGKLMPIAEITNATTQGSEGGKPSRVTATGSEDGGERQQMETSLVKRNYVREIVNKFNKEATLRRERKESNFLRTLVENIRYKYTQPSEPPIDYDDVDYTTNKPKNYIVFKMISGKVPQKIDTSGADCHGGNHKDQCDYPHEPSNLKSEKNLNKTQSNDEYVNSEKDDKLTVVHLSSEQNCETLDKRNGLFLYSTAQTNSFNQHPGGNCQDLVKRHQTWYHDRGHINSEDAPPKPGRRRVRSYESILGDKNIRERTKHELDKRISIEVLDQTSHERVPTLRSQILDGIMDKEAQRSTRDIGIQCNTQSFKDQSLQSDKQQSQIINPMKTYDSIFSILEEEERESLRNQPLTEDVQSSSQTEKVKKNEHKKTNGLTLGNGTLRHVKTKNRSFGFKLNTGFLVKNDCVGCEDKDANLNGKEWYDESVDIHLKNQKTYQDIFTEKNDSPLIQEVDSRKTNVKYQNPLSNEGKRFQRAVEASDLWHQAVKEDCLQIRSLRNNSMGKQKALPRAKLYSINYENLEETRHKTPEDVVECAIIEGLNPRFKSSLEFRENKAPQSELSCIRGGLAVAYKTRQKVAQEKRSSSFCDHIENLPETRLSGYDSDTTRCGKKTLNNEVHQLKRRVEGSSKSGSHPIIEPHGNHSMKRCQKNSPRTANGHLQSESGPRVSKGSDKSVSQCSQEKTISCENSPFIEHKSVSNETIVSANHRSDWKDTSSSPQNSVQFQEKDKSGEEDTEDLLKPLCKQKSLNSEDSLAKSTLKRRHSVPKNAKLAWLKLKLKSKPSK